MYNRIANSSYSRCVCTILIVFVLSVFSAGDTFAQTSPNPEIQSATINVDELLNVESFYFIDQLGLDLGRTQFAQEGYIDEDSYILGTGDIFSIEYVGAVSGTMRGIRVNPQGDVVLPNIGAIRVNDLTMSEARDRIAERTSEEYRDTEVALSLEKARPITIHLTGDVPWPGKREVNALTRVDQAVYTAFFEHDPRAMQTGSAPYRYRSDFLDRRDFTLRNISIRGVNGEQRSADLIAYFKGGITDSNPIVRDGDIITIQRMRGYSPTITISGAVKSADELEYRPNDTLADMLTIANGLSHDADQRIIHIHRMEDGNIRRIEIDTELEDVSEVSLSPNDRIIVPFNRERQNNRAAWVYGEAVSPGNYPIIDGQTTAYDLMEMAGGPTQQALSHGAYVIRGNPSGGLTPGSEQDAAQLKRTSDQLMQGFEYLDLEVGLNQNQIFLDVADSMQLSAIRIFDGDRIHIPRDDQTIFMMGQVRNPGFYPYEEHLSVDDYIVQAGNFALAAEEDRVFVIKSGSRTWYRPDETRIESGDIIFVDRTPYDELQASRTYDLQKRTQRNSNIQLIMTGLATVTSIITTYVALFR